MEDYSKPKTSITAIIISVVISAVVIGGGIYFYMDDKATKDQETLKNQISTLETEKADLEKQISGSATTDETTDETADWKTYESEDLGLTFKFPNISGTTQYSFNEYPKRDYDPAGTIYGWTIKRTDIENKPDWTYTFAGGNSSDASAGRSSWPTDNYRWVTDNNKYYLERMDDSKVEIMVDKVSKQPSGAEGIILISEKNKSLFSSDDSSISGKLAVVNFPSTYDKKPLIKSISFYFYDTMTTNQIEKVIESLSFTN